MVFSQKAITIGQSNKMVSVGKEVYFLEDKNASLTFKDILKNKYQRRFRKHTKNTFNRPASKSVFWFKFTVKNQSEEDIWFETGNATSNWYLDFYAPDDVGEYTNPRLLGALRPLKNREFPSNHYCIRLAKSYQKNIKTYYLKVSGSFTKKLSLKIGTTQTLTQHLKTNDYIVATFVGLILGMFFYNSFIFLSTKDKTYLIYIAYLLVTALFIPFNNGYPFIYKPWIWEYYFVWHSILPALITLFAVYYLQLAKHSRFLYLLLLIITIIISILLPLVNLFKWIDMTLLFKIFQPILLFHIVILLICGIYLWSKGEKKARFYTLAWVFMLSSIAIFLLTINDIIPINLFTHHIMYFGFSMEALMFAIALGDRLNILKDEKDKAQLKNLKLVNNQKEVLEKKVQERTLELQNSNEELQVMNEELRQTQEELQTQRDYVEEQNKELEFFNNKISNSIKSAKTIQEALLPTEDKLSRTLTNYFLIYHPKDIVSGDFYWTTEEDNKVFLAVADCTGHGVPGAFMANMGVNFLYSIIKQKKINNPAEVLDNLHHEISVSLKQKKSKNNNGMDIALLCIEKINQHKIKIQFCGAKRPLYYIKPNDSEINEIKETRKSIGGIQNDGIKFENKEFILEKDSIIYLGSDGLEDQNNLKRKKFGKKRLMKILTEIKDLPLVEQKQRIETELNQHMKNTTQRDDILWMGIRI